MKKQEEIIESIKDQDSIIIACRQLYKAVDRFCQASELAGLEYVGNDDESLRTVKLLATILESCRSTKIEALFK